MLSAGGWLWYAAQTGLQEIEQELQAAVQVQMWAMEQGRVELVAGRPDRGNAQLRQQIAQEIADLRTALHAADDTVMAPSPALLNIPTELGDDEVFYQSVVYPLAGLLLEKTVQQSSGRWNFNTEQGQLYLKALQLWQLWESDGPLSIWRDEIMRWLDLNSRANLGTEHQSLPDQYEQLCCMYRVWNLLPGHTSIPLACASADRSLLAFAKLPTWLDEFSSFQEYNDKPSTTLLSDTLGLVTVVEYFVATFGHDRLPALTDAFGRYSSWETLTQTAFDISAAEFETGWQTYLAERYGSGP